jgi:hypothetical protein
MKVKKYTEGKEIKFSSLNTTACHSKVTNKYLDTMIMSTTTKAGSNLGSGIDTEFSKKRMRSSMKITRRTSFKDLGEENRIPI